MGSTDRAPSALGCRLDPESLDIGAFVVVGVGIDQGALDELVRGNASISAHFQRNVTSSLSQSDAAAVGEVTSHYDNYHHGLEHATQSETLTEDFLRRFCVIGPPEECVERLGGLVGLGLSHLVTVGGSRDIDAAVRERSDHLVAKEVLPALLGGRGGAGASRDRGRARRRTGGSCAA